MTKMKKYLILIVLLLVGCSNNLGATAVEKGVSKLKSEQESIKKSTGKYKHIPKHKVGDEEIEITEYETAKGEVGYQIIYYKNGQAYKSEATGVESESRTWENNIEEKIEISSSTYETTK